MQKWAIKFITDHGDRLFFMGVATSFGGLFYYLGLIEEGKTILTFVAGVAVNQCRSPRRDK